MADLIITNAKVSTLDRENPEAEAIAIRDGKFLAVGSERRCAPPPCPKPMSSTQAAAG
jgi:predicted amidohydrolase YtcJ